MKRRRKGSRLDWAVYARPGFGTDLELADWVQADDEASALAKAQQRLANGSGYHPDTAKVIHQPRPEAPQ